jgi:hypothetical protein
MNYLVNSGIIFILFFSGCLFVPTKVVEKEYVCADGTTVQDATECRVAAPEERVEYVEIQSNASGNSTWACSEDMPYIAGRMGKTYHLRTCTFAKRIDQGKALCFRTREEAEALGYVLCKTCMKHMTG